MKKLKNATERLVCVSYTFLFVNTKTNNSQATTYSILFDLDFAKTNQTLYEDKLKYDIKKAKLKSESESDKSTDEEKINQIHNFYLNKLNATMSDSLMTIMKGDYPNSTSDDKIATEVSILLVFAISNV